MITNRKKIALITQVKTKFTFFIHYAEAGGANNIINHFKNTLINYFQQNALPELALETQKLFADEITFSKTIDKSILAHMNDFKRCATPYKIAPNTADWIYAANDINIMPINACTPIASYALDYFNKLFGCEIARLDQFLY